MSSISKAAFLLSATMFRNVWASNSPHGEISVWESLHPGDSGTMHRFVVAMDGKLKNIVLDAFERDGFVSCLGSTKAEAISEAKAILKCSAATQHPRLARDSVLRGKRIHEWESIRSKFPA